MQNPQTHYANKEFKLYLPEAKRAQIDEHLNEIAEVKISNFLYGKWISISFKDCVHIELPYDKMRTSLAYNKAYFLKYGIPSPGMSGDAWRYFLLCLNDFIYEQEETP